METHFKNKWIVLVVLEALRPDHTSLYGYARATTPFLTRIAEKAAVFDQCFTVAPRTWQAFSSLLPGLYPSGHRVRIIGGEPLDARHSTLATFLADAGWENFGHTDDLHQAGLARGFRVFDPPFGSRFRSVNRLKGLGERLTGKPSIWACDYERDRQRTNAALHWMRTHPDSSGLVLLRYFCTHWPYHAPPQQIRHYGDCHADAHRFQKDARFKLVFENDLTPAEREHAIAHYDGGITYLDSEIRRLADGVAGLGLTDRTLFVVTSDHGEGLGDHDYWFEHGDQLYDEAIHIPLLMWGPEVAQNKRISHQVQLLDVMPTLLEWAGLDIPDGLDGSSLWGQLSGQGSGREYIFAESGYDFHGAPWRTVSGTAGYLRMIRNADWKLIFLPQAHGDLFELYHLTDDPRELNDVKELYPEVFQDLHRRLFAWIDANDLADAENVEVDPQVEERLRQLGYLE